MKAKYTAQLLGAEKLVEIDRLRKMRKVFEDTGLGGCAQARDLDRRMAHLHAQVKQLEADTERQHRECGAALLASFLAIDLLNEALDDMAHTFKINAVFDAKNSATDYIAECRKLARECNHITTNMGVEDIAGAYGDYVADRCLEMFNFIEFKGNSYR